MSMLVAPVSLLLTVAKCGQPSVLFCLNFTASIPLARLLSAASNQMWLKFAEWTGSPTSTFWGNEAEALIGLMALTRSDYPTALNLQIGSILSNAFLTLGLGSFCYGLRHNTVIHQLHDLSRKTAALVLLISVPVAVVPSIERKLDATSVSIDALVVIAGLYTSYFALTSAFHRRNLAPLPNDAEEQVNMLRREAADEKMSLLANPDFFNNGANEPRLCKVELEAVAGYDSEPAQLSVTTAVCLICIVSVALFVLSGGLLDCMDEFATQLGTSRAFISLIILPLIGNMAQHAEAIASAIEGNIPAMLEHSIVRSLSMVLPLGVCEACLVALSLSYDMPVPYLDFDMYQQISLFATVGFVNLVIGQKRLDWLDGILYTGVYTTFAGLCLQI